MSKHGSGKVGRNDPCPCGSGSKFKFCHGRPRDLPPGRRSPLKDQAEYVARKFREHELKEAAHRNRVGNIMMPIAAVVGDQRVVSVHGKIYWTDVRRTPLDFMDTLMGEYFGDDWWNTETAKPELDRHPVAFWYASLAEQRAKLPRSPRGYVSSPTTGIHAAWYTLAWDLWITANHGLLPPAMLHRLRDFSEFQGARYELTALTTFLRAGYDATLENAEDKSETHPEFLAKAPGSGEIVSVETKSRRRPGVLGYVGSAEQTGEVKAGITRLLHQALEKADELPHIVFIDLNMPPFVGHDLMQEPAIKEVMSVLGRKFKKYANDDGFPGNLLIFTNNPHHYGSTDKPNPMSAWAIWSAPNPKHPFVTADVSPTLGRAMRQYGTFPLKWEDLGVGPVAL
jgi:hypothetical protein